jgi:hypothetical protein
MAYMDDVSILAMSFEAAQQAIAVIEAKARELCIEVNAKKCEVLARQEPPQAMCVGWPRVSVVKLLGASVGFDNDAERVHLEQRFSSKFQVWFSRLKKCYGPYATALLGCAGVPKAGFVMRVDSAQSVRQD